MPAVVYNPKSGLLIAAGKPRHLELVKAGTIPKNARVYSFVRGTIPWRELMPKTLSDRQELEGHCKNCFLLPAHSPFNDSDRPKFPICVHGTRKGACGVSCYGIVAALRRANLNYYSSARTAKDKEKVKFLREKAMKLLDLACSARSVPQSQARKAPKKFKSK